MNQSNPKTPGKNVNFFLVPHIPLDDDKLRRALSHAERDFFLVLCHLSNRYAAKDGWFWHTDKLFATRENKERGFAAYGFGQSTCKRVRKKLLQLELIETKKGTAKYGRWPGTAYRINPRLYKSTGGHSEPRSGSIENLHHRPP
jgi:hypothetical protein